MGTNDIINWMIGIPIGVLGNVSTKAVTNIYNNYFNQNIEPLEKIFITSFIKSIEYHNKRYDKTSKSILDNIKKEVKKDKEKLISVFRKNTLKLDDLLQKIGEEAFNLKIANDILEEFKIESNWNLEIIVNIISDSLQYYKTAFFNNMNEKEAFITILKESLKIDSIVDILVNLNSSIATKDDVESLKKMVLSVYYNKNSLEQKGLTDYDKYIINNFRYLELRGISPKVSGEEVKMELLDLYVSQEVKESKHIMPEITEREKLKISTEKSMDMKSDDMLHKNLLSSNKLLEHQYTVIIGDPGAGKSTLLKYLALYISKKRSKLVGTSLSFAIPIYIKATQYSDYLEKNPECSLYEFITQHYDKQYNKFIENNFEYSNILLFLDALDEIRNTSLRIKVSEQVHKLISKYPYNKYIVTSRIVGYQESRLSSEFKHFKLMPFQEGQIKTFAHNWYNSIAKHSDKNYQKADEVAEELYNSIFINKSVFKVAENPLLMTIISMIHYKGKRLPNKRIELYDICTETFLEYWVQLRVSDESRIKSKDEIIEILSPISFFIHKNQELGLIEEKDFKKQFINIYKSIHITVDDYLAKKECNDFIDFLRKDAGFFYEKGQDDDGDIYYGFIHQTFQEYFAAIDFLNKLEFDSLSLEDYVFDSRWVEIIRLAVAQIRLSNKGIAGRKKSSELINNILNVEDKFIELYRPLQLVCLILADDVEVTNDTYIRIILDITNLLSNKCNEIIIKSFSEIFKNLIKSNYCDRILSDLIIKNTNGDGILLGNLMKLIIDNYEDDKIKSVFKNIIDKVKFSLNSLENIIDYAMESRVENKDCIESLISNNLSLLSSSDKGLYYHEIYYDFCGYDKEKAELLILNNIKNSEVTGKYLYDILQEYLDSYLCHFTYRRIEFENQLKYLKKFKMTKNLLKCLENLNYESESEKELGGARYYRRYEATNYKFLIITSDKSKNNKDALIWYWDKEFKEVSYYLLNMRYIERFELELSNKNLYKREIEDLKVLIDYIIHFEILNKYSLEDDDKKKFYYLLDELYKRNLLIQVYRWTNFLIKNPCYEKSVFSNVIIENMKFFLSNVTYEDNSKVFCESDVHVLPCIKLFYMHLNGEVASEELIDEVIDYFRIAPENHKNGIVILLDKLLNQFEFTF